MGGDLGDDTSLSVTDKLKSSRILWRKSAIRIGLCIMTLAVSTIIFGKHFNYPYITFFGVFLLLPGSVIGVIFPMASDGFSRYFNDDV